MPVGLSMIPERTCKWNARYISTFCSAVYSFCPMRYGLISLIVDQRFVHSVPWTSVILWCYFRFLPLLLPLSFFSLKLFLCLPTQSPAASTPARLKMQRIHLLKYARHVCDFKCCTWALLLYISFCRFNNVLQHRCSRYQIDQSNSFVDQKWASEG